MTRKLRLAAVGLGRWAYIQADSYTKSDKIELVTCFSRNPEKRQKFAAKYGCQTDESYEALLAREDVDAVIVTVPNDAHADVIVQAIEAGKHVCVEKPISITMEDAKKIEDALAKHPDIKFTVLHSARRLGGLRKMKELIDSGRVGQVSTIEVNFSNERGLEIKPGNWRGNPAQAPGGPLTQLGVHQIDNIQYLLGRVKRVFCFGKPMYTEVENATVTQTICELESGQQAYIAANWACPGVFSINVFGTKANLYYTLDFSWWSNSDVTDKYTTLKIQEFATMTDDPDNRELKISDVEIPICNHLLDEMEEFADAVLEGGSLEIGVKEATHNVAVVLAAVKSMYEGRIVEVSEIEG
ncbi:MAG: Gfo/Idh/MocA family oxidoreductase [Clostridia bacterium]|nr:Gfo/Idh/MocA family oxidoreductase [Clostridia bacterium]